MEIMDENNGVAEEQEEFQRLEMQVEEEAVFPQENVQSTDPSVPMDTQGVEAQEAPPHIPWDFGGIEAKYFRIVASSIIN